MAETKGGGFTCPNCGEVVTSRTIDSRMTLYGRRRRRICENCGKRFTTVEYCISKPTAGGDSNANKQVG